MDLVGVFLNKDGNAHLRPFKDVDGIETIYLRVLMVLSYRNHIGSTFVLAFDPEKNPLTPIADLASYNAWEPTEQQLQQVRSWLVEEELKRLQVRDRQ